jgi:hypothetical protein
MTDIRNFRKLLKMNSLNRKEGNIPDGSQHSVVYRKMMGLLHRLLKRRGSSGHFQMPDKLPGVFQQHQGKPAMQMIPVRPRNPPDRFR